MRGAAFSFPSPWQSNLLFLLFYNTQFFGFLDRISFLFIVVLPLRPCSFFFPREGKFFLSPLLDLSSTSQECKFSLSFYLLKILEVICRFFLPSLYSEDLLSSFLRIFPPFPVKFLLGSPDCGCFFCKTVAFLYFGCSPVFPTNLVAIPLCDFRNRGPPSSLLRARLKAESSRGLPGSFRVLFVHPSNVLLVLPNFQSRSHLFPPHSCASPPADPPPPTSGRLAEWLTQVLAASLPRTTSGTRRLHPTASLPGRLVSFFSLHPDAQATFPPRLR